MGEFFLNPWFLAGAAGAAIPVVIHLLIRRRYRRVPWAAMDLLLRAFKKTNRRLRIENLLILLLRMAAIALLAMALARPVLRSAGVAGQLGEKTRTVYILLDNSYSMRYTRGKHTPFEGAKKSAADLLESLSPGTDAAALILVSDLPDVIYGEPTPEIEKVKQALGECQPGFGVSDLAEGLERLGEILENASAKAGVNREVYFFTDGQRLAWLRGEEDGEQAVTRKLEKLAGEIELFSVVVVGEESTENLGVEKLTSEERVIGLGKQATFAVEVVNHGSDPGDVHVEFLVDGSSPFSTHVSVPAGGKQSARFQPVFDAPGAHWVMARIGADGLLTDNERFFALRVRERIKVLLVDGEPASEGGGGIFGGETAHLELALLPAEGGEAPEGLSIIQPTVVKHFELDAPLLGRPWDLIILANEGTTLPMDPSLLDALFRYVKGGGSLLVFLGDRVRPRDYNEQLWRGGEGILPLPLGEVRGDPNEPVGLEFRGRLHPVFQVFDDPAFRTLLTRKTTSFYIGMEVPDPPPEGVRVAARFSSGAPAVVEKTVGDEPSAGRVMVVATSADAEWTDLPKGIAFLPLVHEMVYHLVREDQGRRNLPVGSMLYRNLNRSQYSEDITVSLPGGGRTALEPPRDLGEGRFQAVWGPLSEPGPYTLAIRKGAGEAGYALKDVFAANVDPAEGDLRRVSEEFVEGLVPPGLLEKFAFDRERYEKREAEAPGGAEVWRPLLFALVGVLVLETILAQRFGDYSR